MFDRCMRGVSAAFVLAVPTVCCAALDGNVQWDRLSHVPTADRRPLVPIDREAFDVVFQTAHFDVTSARVRVDPGADGEPPFSWSEASWESARGPVDVWRASLPASASDRVAYVIEISDGEDTDYLGPAGAGDELPGEGWVVDFATLSHAPRGNTSTSRGSVFRVWAPNATTATVRGSFNNWSGTAMTRYADDFIAHVPSADPGDEYKYFFDGSVWKPDPYARALDQGSSYNAIVTDALSYQWNNPDFTPAPRPEWVVYQLHVGTFAGLNDPVGPTPPISRFRDVTARVDHLRELGVNAVMMNPINEFPSERSGGYNTLSVHAIESSYGTPAELKEMVDTLHGAGIALILDVVWNHMPSGGFLETWDGGEAYFDDPPVGTPWGPQTDVDRVEVREFYFDSVETILGEFMFDGYRHDAIYELVSASQYAAGQQLMRDAMSRIRSRFPDAHVVGEVYNNSAWNVTQDGIHLHGQYHEAYKNAIKQAVDSAAFGDPDMGRLAASIDGSGPFVEFESVFNYYELHDEAWPLSGEGRTRAVAQIDVTAPHDDRYALGRTKLANAVTILSQGMPAILMGTEWAEDNGWENFKIDWSHKETYREVFDFYRDLIHLRTTRPSLFANSGCSVYHVNDGANVIAFERFGADGRSYVVVANFSNTDFEEYNMGVPRQGAWGVIMNSEDSRYRGTGFGTMPGPVAVEDGWHSGHGQFVRLRLPAHGMLVLQHDPEFIVEPDAVDRTLDGVVNAADVEGFLRDLADGLPQADLNADLGTDAFDLMLWQGVLAGD